MSKNKKRLLEILKVPDYRLRLPNVDVAGYKQDWLIELAQDIIYTAKNVKGSGLAAPQIGRNIRLIVAFLDRNPLVLLNPQIIEHAKEYVSIIESCLSCGDEAVRIPRYEWIEVRYNLLSGVEKTSLFGGINAIILQHEIDHCRGKLIVDYKNEKVLV